MFEESKVDGWLAALCAEILTSRLTPLLRMTAEKGCAPPQDDREKDDGKKEIWRYIFVASAEKAWHSRVMLN